MHPVLAGFRFRDALESEPDARPNSGSGSWSVTHSSSPWSTEYPVALAQKSASAGGSAQSNTTISTRASIERQAYPGESPWRQGRCAISDVGNAAANTGTSAWPGWIVSVGLRVSASVSWEMYCAT